MSNEKRPPHIEYRLISQKAYELDHAPGVDCYDHLDGIIHGKEDSDRLVKFLQENGFKVKLARASKTFIVDDKFDGEEEGPESEAS